MSTIDHFLPINKPVIHRINLAENQCSYDVVIGTGELMTIDVNGNKIGDHPRGDRWSKGSCDRDAIDDQEIRCRDSKLLQTDR